VAVEKGEYLGTPNYKAFGAFSQSYATDRLITLRWWGPLKNLEIVIARSQGGEREEGQ
jgi:hypothetical protein